MPRQSRAGGTLPVVRIDATSPAPLYEQLYSGIRERIVSGHLPPGARLASTRALASDLGLSRFTVVTAINQLTSEGYLKSSARGGTFVAQDLPERTMRVSRGAANEDPRSTSPIDATPNAGAAPVLSARGRALGGVIITGPRSEIGEPRPFRPRRPPLDTFPFALWARLVRRQWHAFRHTLLDYGEPAGYRPLREAVAAHLQGTRGVQCAAERVVITSGAQQAFDLLFRLLLDPGDAAWIEEPGYLDVRGALVAAGARLVPVPVDAEGIDVAKGRELAPSARLAYVSPSHQYPTGATLSNARRVALLEWAEEANAWIVEDDYDSYFRYRGRPLPALQRLDADRHPLIPNVQDERRIAYVGTFSKTMFPSLRLGYCVVPERLVDAVANARAVADRNSPLADQAALTMFITDGHYDRHLRRVRATCVERYEAMVHHVDRELGRSVTVAPATAGTHVLGTLDVSRDKSSAAVGRVVNEAAADGMVVFPLSRYCLAPPREDALVLGYGGLTPPLIASGVRRLARAMERARLG
jgi:GntR family transcriptional regulator / MocR family aminotransferase